MVGSPLSQSQTFKDPAPQAGPVVEAADAHPVTSSGFDDLPRLFSQVWEETGVTLGRDDPIIAAYVMLKAFIKELQRVGAQRDAQLSEGIASVVNESAKTLQCAITQFKDRALTEGLKSTLNQIVEQRELAARIHSKLRWLAMIIAVLTIGNLIAAGITLAAVYLVVK